MIKLDEKIFLVQMEKILIASEQYGNFRVIFTDFNRLHPKKSELEIWGKEYDVWKEKAATILNIIRAGCYKAEVYGARFSRDSFYGHGEAVERILTKNGKSLRLDLSGEFFEGYENFWSGVCNKSPPSSSGDIYFFCHTSQILWEKLFAATKAPIVAMDLGKRVHSKSGLKHVRTWVAEHPDEVVIGYDSKGLYVIAGSAMAELVKLAMAYSEFKNPRGEVFETERPRPEIVFGRAL